MEIAAYIGINIYEFWEMTPKEMLMYINSFNKRKNEEIKELIYQAYLIAAWSRVKRLPNIKEILDKKPEKQSPEQILAKVKMLNTILGGNVY